MPLSEEAYLETTQKYGFAETPGIIAQGDYSEFVDKQVERLCIATRMPRPLDLPMMRWLLPVIVSARSVGLRSARIL
ncbi:MAG: hypothetical protein V8Q83_06630 [Blautia sp.]